MKHSLRSWTRRRSLLEATAAKAAGHETWAAFKAAQQEVDDEEADDVA
jgi:hypothetical protein